MAQLDLHFRVAENDPGPIFADSTSNGLKDPVVIGDITLQELFADNVFAKVWRVANRDLENNNPPTAYPEFVPQSGAVSGRYTLREADLWTCGFFPGTLYSLLERVSRYPRAVAFPRRNEGEQFQDLKLSRENLLSLCRTWAEPLHAMTGRTDTHDLGFIAEPALRLDWVLTGNNRSLNSLITAANSLATRYDSRVGAIRRNFIVIIDSLCNLELLFYASAHSKSNRLAVMAKRHAETLLRTHLRHEPRPAISKSGYEGQLYSTCHVANLDPRNGNVKRRMTAQGYPDSSTWARDAACGLAEYFLQRLGSSHKVPPWDFDAPVEDPENPVLDSSAGAIAANGMLLIAEALVMNNQPTLSKKFQDPALEVVRNLLRYSLTAEKAKFTFASYQTGFEKSSALVVDDEEDGKSFDAILKNATANNNAGANRRYWNHGLVYADYYLVRFGNELLRMGLA
ncbi:Six-hairpin glycosidase-like protein [Leptodontidium sp. 2 PMI_412]|nr:Six-hairpin glycosidase-like protein [Leptodontidium sp. 2 PMI_412]